MYVTVWSLYVQSSITSTFSVVASENVVVSFIGSVFHDSQVKLFYTCCLSCQNILTAYVSFLDVVFIRERRRR